MQLNFVLRSKKKKKKLLYYTQARRTTVRGNLSYIARNRSYLMPNDDVIHNFVSSDTIILLYLTPVAMSPRYYSKTAHDFPDIDVDRPEKRSEKVYITTSTGGEGREGKTVVLYTYTRDGNLFESE